MDVMWESGETACWGRMEDVGDEEPEETERKSASTGSNRERDVGRGSSYWGGGGGGGRWET